LTVPVVAWDERHTSKSAEGLLIEANVSRKKRKTAVDRVAAAILLQSYLDARSSACGSAAQQAEDDQGEGGWEGT
jgi:putative Holliday junction resolvase